MVGRRHRHRFVVDYASPIAAAFQAFYTYLFGVYASYIHIRTPHAHCLPPIVVHMFCNWVGFPDLDPLIDGEPMHRFGYAALYSTGILLWLNGLSMFDYVMFK